MTPFAPPLEGNPGAPTARGAWPQRNQQRSTATRLADLPRSAAPDLRSRCQISRASDAWDDARAPLPGPEDQRRTRRPFVALDTCRAAPWWSAGEKVLLRMLGELRGVLRDGLRWLNRRRSLVAAVQAARELVPGDNNFGDPMSTGGTSAAHVSATRPTVQRAQSGRVGPRRHRHRSGPRNPRWLSRKAVGAWPAAPRLCGPLVMGPARRRV